MRRLLVMHGRSVFARFTRIATLEGETLDRLNEDALFRDKAHRGALSVALLQIDKAAVRPS